VLPVDDLVPLPIVREQPLDGSGATLEDAVAAARRALNR
jgi:hypothetical protein